MSTESASARVVAITSSGTRIHALVIEGDSAIAISIETAVDGGGWRLGCECGAKVYVPGATWPQLCPHLQATGRALAPDTYPMETP